MSSPAGSAPAPERLKNRACALWVHDDKFSKEDVLFNAGIFPERSVEVGDLLQVVPLNANSDVKDFQQKHDAAAPTSGDHRPSDALVINGSRPATGGKSSVQHGKTSGRHDDRFAERCKHCIFVVRQISSDIKSRYPSLQLSIHENIAKAFGLRNRSQVMLSVIDRAACAASHAEVVLRNEYLSRADMWRLAISDLVDRPVYKGQKLLFLGSIKATIKSLYIDGHKVSSAYFSPQTIPIFRSESARFVIFIQMSKEMWDFDSEGYGEIMFNRVINGFLPELFKRWEKINARHLVSIVMFTRMEYDRRVAMDASSFKPEAEPLFTNTKGPSQRLKDFYRVVVSDMASGQWTIILNELKREFRIFLRDVSIQKVDNLTGSTAFPTPQKPTDTDHPDSKAVIVGAPTTALRGNILEAINIASSQFSSDYIDRDLVRTGISVVVITAGTGIFEVDAMALARTTENLTNNGIGIDLVCLSKMPLHSVPLFKFRKPQARSNIAAISASKDSFRGHSPPVSYSPIGSFPASQTLEVSPSTTTEFGSVTGAPSKIFSLDPPDVWDYHIPQWIDISFWASETDRARRVTKDVGRTGSLSHVRQAQDFAPRVRMYEVQMMGVMENEMSNIFIPYLSEDATLGTYLNPQRQRNRFLKAYPGASPQRGSSPSPNRAVHSNVPSQSTSFKDYAAKRRFLTGHVDQQPLGTDWMDVHDDMVFKRFKKPVKSIDRAKLVGQQKAGSNSLRLPGRTSLDDELSPEDRRPIIPKISKNELTFSDPRPAPKTPVSMVKVPPKSRLTGEAKPARISRQISFALRGLGPAPPRAVASTEIHTENAKAAIPLSGASASLGFTPSKKSATTADNSTVLNNTNVLEEKPSSDAILPAMKLQTSTKMDAASPSRPISIKNAVPNILEDATLQVDQGHSFSTATTQVPLETKNIDIPLKDPARKDLNTGHMKTDSGETESDIFRSGHKKRPWIKTINPSNPTKNDPKTAVSFGRWQHVYPHSPRTSSVKWKSLCSPAAVPLTTEDFPSADELITDYAAVIHDVVKNNDHELSEKPPAIEVLIRDMICSRFSHGYQIVVGHSVAGVIGQKTLDESDVFSIEALARDNTVVIMSMGNTIQRLECMSGGRVQVTKYTRKALPELLDPTNEEQCFSYLAAIRTILATDYAPRAMKVEDVGEPYDWKLLDSFVAGHDSPDADDIDTLRFWRARFVLVPVDLPSIARRGLPALTEDSEEEIRLEGIRKITQMWQRYRYIQADERRFQSSIRKRKDTNPLDILYQTRNLSEVIAAELDRSLLADTGLESGPTQLLPDSELLQRDNINLSTLAQTIQGEKGITIINRRWHWRLHYSCFIGVELTSWLLQNFRDIDTREEAVDFGNELMKNGLFQHVEKRHNFRDGNYFYQIAADYRLSRPENKGGWFPGRKPDKSVPSTPMTDTLFKDSPLAVRSRSSSNNDDETTDSSAPTPTKLTVSRRTVNLSKSMRYDVDHRKRSDRPEIIELHYDRIHNPDNCYHFRIDWLNVTPKLIEDAIVTWATTAEKYGLKLVEVPMAEAATISEKEPFRSPYLVHLKVQPPKGGKPSIFSTTSFSPLGPVDRTHYQKAILKKFNFVLDLEAASDFPPDVDVNYSWGKPNYMFPQYIHRSGVALAQITDDGNFLLTANRLYNTRSATSKEAGKLEREEVFHWKQRGLGDAPPERASPHPSPLVRATPDVLGGGHAHFDMSSFLTTPERIKDDLEVFCTDAEKLIAFYDSTSAKSSPAPTTGLLEASIPSLRLPPSIVLRRDPSPAPQHADAGLAAAQRQPQSGQSPRGSVVDSI